MFVFVTATVALPVAMRPPAKRRKRAQSGAVANDARRHDIRATYQERPTEIVPQTVATFGGNGLDIEPPFVRVHSPEDGVHVGAGIGADLRVEVDDSYDGMGWWIVGGAPVRKRRVSRAA
jgi:hypothetical protein